MNTKTWTIGGMGLACAVTALSAVIAVQHPRPNGAHAGPQPGASRLVAFTTRSDAQRGDAGTERLDASLAALVRHLRSGQVAPVLSELHAANPAARYRVAATGGTPLVLVDAAARGNPAALRDELAALGMERIAVYRNVVGGWLPVDRVAEAAVLPQLAAMHASMPHRRGTGGAVATQGDYAQGSYALRSAFPTLQGTGVTVGVISDSFDCYDIYAQPNSGVPQSGYQGWAYNGFTAGATSDEGDGALPATVTVLSEPGTSSPTVAGNCLNYGAPYQAPFADEGRAMMQVLHVVAPGAALAFYTGDDSEASFATGIQALAAAGSNVIVDDIGYYDEPFYQDGLIAQAIEAVNAAGVAYFSAAGNDGNAAWESTAPAFTTKVTSGNNKGETLVNFDTTGATNALQLPVTIAPLLPGEFVAIVVQWDQPYVTGSPDSGGATSQLDVCLIGTTSVYPILEDYAGNTGNCTGPNALGTDPVQVLIIGNPANATSNTPQETLALQVGLANGTKAPGRLIVAVETDGQTSPAPISQFATNSETLQGHPGAAGAAAVGAAFYYNTQACDGSSAQLEPYSAQGGAPILFDSNGTRLTTAVFRQKPDFIGPDGINTTFLGQVLSPVSTTAVQCDVNTSYPSFFGTSAAAPHAAGVAALMLQSNPAATPAQIYSALQMSAAAMPSSGATPNYLSGYGFIQANAALALLPLGAPTLSLSASAVQLGQSSTLSWSSVGTQACTAGGAWSGAQATSGSLVVTPSSTGSFTYTLSCASSTGSVSPVASVTLTVVAPSQTPTLSLSATTIQLGQSSTLTWSSSGAQSCAASGAWSGTQATSGSLPVTPSATGSFTYALNCTNSVGGVSPTASVTLTVVALPQAPTLSLSVNTITLGQSTALTWSTTTASSCTASGAWSGAQATSGSLVVTPSSTGSFTYALSCTSATGSVSPVSYATLTVIAPPQAPTLALSATTIQLGQSSTLTWSTTTASSCTASGAWSGTEATNGSLAVTPSSTGSFKYSLSCTDSTGGVSPTTSVTLTVDAVPSSGGGGGGGGGGAAGAGELALLGALALWSAAKRRAAGTVARRP